MRERAHWLVTGLISLLVAMLALTAQADAQSDNIGLAAPLTVGRNEGTMGPGQYQWYKFVVPQEYSPEQQKRDERGGAKITPHMIWMEYDDANNPEVAHGTGFRLFDPEHAKWVFEQLEPPVRRDSQGVPLYDEEGNRLREPIYWAEGWRWYASEEAAAVEATGQDTVIGRPKQWEGTFHAAGTYYIQVYNESRFPMSYSLWITGWNLQLAER
jgi:hypothetical protein